MSEPQLPDPIEAQRFELLEFDPDRPTGQFVAFTSHTRTFAIAVALTLIAAACGSPNSVDPPAAPTEPTIATTAPGGGGPAVTLGGSPESRTNAGAVVLSEPDANLVTAESRWLCDVQQRSFTELSDLAQAQASLLANYSITADEYDSFKIRLETDATLRTEVRNAFSATCQA